LARDLRLARKWTDHVAIFSLEGCLRQGYLGRLKEFDWQQPVNIPAQTVKRVDIVRKGFQFLLWTTTRPWIILAGMLMSLLLILRLRTLLKKGVRT
jgi:hypothetical protein